MTLQLTLMLEQLTDFDTLADHVLLRGRHQEPLGVHIPNDVKPHRAAFIVIATQTTRVIELDHLDKWTKSSLKPAHAVPSGG